MRAIARFSHCFRSFAGGTPPETGSVKVSLTHFPSNDVGSRDHFAGGTPPEVGSVKTAIDQKRLFFLRSERDFGSVKRKQINESSKNWHDIGKYFPSSSRSATLRRREVEGMSQPTAHPLAWPHGWPRTRGDRERARFSSRGDGWSKDVTVKVALERLDAELERLGAPEELVVVSTNLLLKHNGWPRSGQPEPKDAGAACYFQVEGEQRVLACDKYDRVADNIVAIAKTLEATRGITRWGCVSAAQAFAGFKALPSAATDPSRPWWEVLGVHRGCSAEDVRLAYRALAKRFHPEGETPDAEMWGSVARAHEDAQRELSTAELTRKLSVS